MFIEKYKRMIGEKAFPMVTDPNCWIRNRRTPRMAREIPTTVPVQPSSAISYLPNFGAGCVKRQRLFSGPSDKFDKSPINVKDGSTSKGHQ